METEGYIIISITVALITSFTFTLKGALFKYCMNKGVDPSQLSLDYQFSGACLYLVYGAIFYFPEEGLVFQDISRGIISGCFDLLGCVSLGLALDTGVSSVVFSLLLLDSVVQTVLSLVVLGQQLHTFELIGLAIGIGATLWISTFNNNNNEDEAKKTESK